MRITAIKLQTRDPDRVNIYVDSVFTCSLDVFQVTELKLKVGTSCTPELIEQLKQESQFGKLYGRAVQYSIARPRSVHEMRQYLLRRTRDGRTKTGEVKPGVSLALVERVLQRLLDKGFVDDEAFTAYWIENRRLKKGVSQRRLKDELRQKGIQPGTIETHLAQSERDDWQELQKTLEKKRARYEDPYKLKQYLARQGFSYDDIERAMNEA